MGDIGDNRARRKFVTVYRVSLGVGDRTVRAPAYRLVYPKRRAHDAESLFADRQGRLYVVTKTFFGGTVYRAPLRLSRSRVNRLQPVGRVREFATDAALMRDGRHLLVRGYDSAGVYDFPSLRRVGDFTLPRAAAGRGDLRRPRQPDPAEQRGSALGGARGGAAAGRWPARSSPPATPATRRLRPPPRRHRLRP